MNKLRINAYADRFISRGQRVLINYFITTVIGCSLFPQSGNSADVTGRMSASVYNSEQTGDDYWQSYIRYNSTANLWQGQGNRSLSLYTNLRWTGDLATQRPRTPETYVYGLYFKLDKLAGNSTIYAGRQFAYNTLGSALIDGLRVKYRFNRSFNIDLYGGATVSQSDPEKIRSFADDNQFGARINYISSPTLRVSANWLATMSDGSLSRHLVGIDGLKSLKQVDLYAKTSYDLVYLELASALGRVTLRTNGWYLSSEFSWRKPTVASNTIFAIIDAEAYKGLRIDMTRGITRDIRLLGQFHNEFLTGEDSWRTVFGVRATHFTIAWHHRDGYGGEHDGLQLQAYLEIKPELELYGSAFISQYKIQPETPDRIDAYSSSAGLEWRPGKAMQFRIEGQFLRNAVDENDFRLFLQVSKGFSLNTSKSGVLK